MGIPTTITKLAFVLCVSDATMGSGVGQMFPLDFATINPEPNRCNITCSHSVVFLSSTLNSFFSSEQWKIEPNQISNNAKWLQTWSLSACDGG